MSAIIGRFRGATALHTTTHRRSQTSARRGPFHYGLDHSRPGGWLRGGGKGRCGLQGSTTEGNLEGADADPTRASRQRGSPQLTHIEKDRARSKRKRLAVKSRATGFPFLSPTSQREAGAHCPASPLGHKSSRVQTSPAAAHPGPPRGPVAHASCTSSLWRR